MEDIKNFYELVVETIERLRDCCIEKEGDVIVKIRGDNKGGWQARLEGGEVKRIGEQK